jgi:hypothetical protein
MQSGASLRKGDRAKHSRQPALASAVPVDFELLSTNNGILAFEMRFATGNASRISRELAETGPESRVSAIRNSAIRMKAA